MQLLIEVHRGIDLFWFMTEIIQAISKTHTYRTTSGSNLSVNNANLVSMSASHEKYHRERIKL